MANRFGRLGAFSVLILAGIVLTGCGSGVSVQSGAFATTGEVALKQAALTAEHADLTEFKFCVKTVRLYADENETVKKEGKDEFEFAPGLIDLSDGKEKSWGEMDIPTDIKVRKLKIKVKKDESLCKQNYSVSFNGVSTPQDIEFQWRFDPAIDLESGDTLNLAMNAVVTALRAAAAGGTLAQIKTHIEAIEGSATKK